MFVCHPDFDHEAGGIPLALDGPVADDNEQSNEDDMNNSGVYSTPCPETHSNKNESAALTSSRRKTPSRSAQRTALHQQQASTPSRDESAEPARTTPRLAGQEKGQPQELKKIK